MANTGSKKSIGVLQVIDTLSVGGAERVIVDMCNILHKNGVHVELLCTVAYGPFLDDLHPDVPRHNLARTSSIEPLPMFKLSRIIRKFDVVHVHMRHVLRYVVACRKIFRFGQPVVFHDHFGDIKIDKSYSRELQKMMLSTFYVSVSDELTEWAIDQVGVDAEKARTISNIVVPQPIDEGFKVDSSRPVKMVQVSNFKSTKHIEFAVDVMAELERRSPGTYYLDVYGKVNDKAYYDLVCSRIKYHELSEDVIRFHHEGGGVQPKLSKYDLALHTAKSESGPLVVMEFMANNLPFLCYDTGEVIKQIKGEITSHILPSFDLNVWVESIESLNLVDVKNSGRLKQVFDKHFSTYAYFQKCISVYNKLAHQQ